jgi:hypothetical protein
MIAIGCVPEVVVARYLDDFSSSGTIGPGAGNTAPDGFDAKSMLMCIRILTL